MSNFDAGDSLTLSDIIKIGIEDAQSTQWTVLPVEVVKVDAAKATVDVQPVMTQVAPDGQPEELPVILSAPIQYVRMGPFILKAPVQVGDLGVVVISSLAFASWFTSGQRGLPPESQRRNNLSDAIYLPGMHASTSPPSAPSGLHMGAEDDSIYLRMSATEAVIEASSIKLGDAATEALTRWPDLLSSLQDIQADLTTLAAAINNIAPGAVPPGALSFAAVLPAPQPPITDASTSKVKGE